MKLYIITDGHKGYIELLKTNTSGGISVTVVSEQKATTLTKREATTYAPIIARILGTSVKTL
jgi:hypothetical protein